MPPGRLRRLAGPGLMTLAMLVALIALGLWQVRRLHWKMALLDRIASAEALPGAPLGPHPAPFAKVRLSGTFLPSDVALYGVSVRQIGEQPVLGADQLVLLRQDDGRRVLVDRGWVPGGERNGAPSIAIPAGHVVLDGYVRPAEHAGWLNARDDIARRHFYALDPAAIGRVLERDRPDRSRSGRESPSQPSPGLDLAPFTVISMGPATGLPIPAASLPRPPNNHLSYALTWFGFAATLAVVFGLWSWKVLRS